MLTLGAKAVKYFLFLINLLYVITGLVLIFIGASIRSKYTDYEAAIDTKMHSVSVFMIIVGFIIFVISFLGCCGACTENRCMILVFSTLISIILLVEICVGILGYVYAGEAQELISQGFKESMKQYGKSNGTTEEWDDLQTNLNCCGVQNYTDWIAVNITKIPWSCCNDANNQTICTEGPKIHTIGCLTALADYIKLEMDHIGNATLVLATIHLLSVFMSCYLARAIKTSQYESV